MNHSDLPLAYYDVVQSTGPLVPDILNWMLNIPVQVGYADDAFFYI